MWIRIRPTLEGGEPTSSSPLHSRASAGKPLAIASAILITDSRHRQATRNTEGMAGGWLEVADTLRAGCRKSRSSVLCCSEGDILVAEPAQCC